LIFKEASKIKEKVVSQVFSVYCLVIIQRSCSGFVVPGRHGTRWARLECEHAPCDLVSATAFGPGLVKSIKTRLRKVAVLSTRVANVI